jgi:hypothetical protein
MFVQMVDLGKKGKDQSRRAYVGQHGKRGVPPMIVHEKWPDDQGGCVNEPVYVHAVVATVTAAIGPIHHAVQCAVPDHAQWDPNTRAEYHKQVGKQYVKAARLMSVKVVVLKPTMNAQQSGKMV